MSSTGRRDPERQDENNFNLLLSRHNLGSIGAGCRPDRVKPPALGLVADLEITRQTRSRPHDPEYESRRSVGPRIHSSSIVPGGLDVQS